MAQDNRLKLPAAPLKTQLANRSLWNDARSLAAADFFTLGYTGRKTETLIEAMKKVGVRTLIDVRHNPVSMYRPDLSKSNLSRLVQSRGIAYEHAPSLGVPRDIRAKAIDTRSREVIWDWYDKAVVGPFAKNLHWLMNAVEAPFAFMCVEIDPHECHRHRLSITLERMGLKGFDL